MKKLLWLAAPLVLALGVMAGGMPGFAASSAPPPAPPGQGDCSHGNTGKDCRPDPSTNGKDCDIHGNNGVGGVNEDHCLATTPTTTTDETSTNQTTTNQTTTNHTTTNQTTTHQTTTSATTTNKTTTTPVTTATTDQSSTISQTITTATPSTTTTAGPSNGTLSASTPIVTKPQLQRELAKQAATARTGGASPERNASGQLPFTGFRGWILVLVGSAVLVAGSGIRRLAASRKKG